MRHNGLRHIASILLLAIYLPTVVLSSLHVHHETVDTQDDCIQCAGHFEKPHHHQHDCLFCNFLTQHYVGQHLEQPDVHLPMVATCTTADVQPSASLSHGVNLLRAPPCSNVHFY